MSSLHFSIDIPVQERSRDAPSAGADLDTSADPGARVRRIASGFVDLPGSPTRRVSVEVARGSDALEVSVRAHDEATSTIYLIPLAWLMRRVAFAHLAYRQEPPRGGDLAPARAD